VIDAHAHMVYFPRAATPTALRCLGTLIHDWAE
jgi:hypothetical protein